MAQSEFAGNWKKKKQQSRVALENFRRLTTVFSLSFFLVECLTQRSTAIGSSVDINPTKGPLQVGCWILYEFLSNHMWICFPLISLCCCFLQGGIPFRLHFEKKLSESLNFGWALFADSQPVKAWKTCQDDVLYGDNIPRAWVLKSFSICLWPEVHIHIN